MKKRKSPVVSVVVPVFNAEKFLDQCLRSIEKQSLKDIEIIVLNDGSCDSSLKIMKKHAKKDKRIVVVDKKNEGYGATCNKGIKLAKGEWIAIVEPDDWIDENMLFDMVNFACESELKFRQKIDIVKTPWFDVKNWDGDDTREFKSYLFSRLKTSKKPTDIAEKAVLLEKHPSIWSAIYRRDFLEENKIKFPKFKGSGWADNPFLIDTMCDAKAIIYLNKPYYHYRVDLPGSTLNHKTDEQVALPFERWCGMTKQLKSKKIKDKRVWQAHYKRGFDYIHGAIVDEGWDNKIVQKQTKRIFDKMKPELVFELETFHPSLKKLYAEIEGEDVALPKLSKEQMKFYAKETGVFLRQRGIKNSAGLAAREVKRVAKSLTRKKATDTLNDARKEKLKESKK